VSRTTLPPIYWINLARSGDRRARMQANLDARALAHTRIEGIDGRDARALRDAIRWVKTTPTEAACIASHLLALRRAFADGHDVALVLEDDTTFDLYDAWPEGWATIRDALPPRFGLVALSAAQEPKPLDALYGLWRGEKRVGKHGYWSTGAYAIERHAIATLLERFDRGAHFDVTPHRPRHDAYSVIMRSWADVPSALGPFVARAPLFLFESYDSEIHPAHLEEHRTARDFIREHHAAARGGTYETRFGPRARARLWLRRLDALRSIATSASMRLRRSRDAQ